MGIDPNTVSGRLNDFFAQCEQRLAVYKYDEMPPLAGQLEVDLRQVKLTMARPDEKAVTATRETVFNNGRAEGWTSEEIDAAEMMAKPSRITAFTYRNVTIEGGREVGREEVRSSMRTASYSNAGWEAYLSTLPKIQAPQEEPR